MPGFDLGWDTAVAAGTIGLAWYTARLAKATRALAETSVDDERAQWRPAIIGAADTEVDFLESDGRMLMAVRNVGRGPALGVSAELRNVAPNPINAIRIIHGLLPNESADFEFPVDKSPPLAIVDFWYHDLAETIHRSRMWITPKDEEIDGHVARVLRIRRVATVDTKRPLGPAFQTFRDQVLPKEPDWRDRVRGWRDRIRGLLHRGKD
jgi:hypothetical protein